MSSVWECSRNDIASNAAVFIAAGAVWLTHSGWPDLIVGVGLVLLFLRSATNVIRSASQELRAVTEAGEKRGSNSASEWLMGR